MIDFPIFYKCLDRFVAKTSGSLTQYELAYQLFFLYLLFIGSGEGDIHEAKDASEQQGYRVWLVEDLERDVVDRPVIDGVKRFADDVFWRAATLHVAVGAY